MHTRRRRLNLTLSTAFSAAAVLGVIAGTCNAATAVAAPETTSVMVRFAGDATNADRAAVGKDLGARSSRPLLAGWRLYRLNDPVSARELRADLADQPDVTGAALDSHASTTAVSFNDTYYPTQWELHNTGQAIGNPLVAGTPGADINFEAALERVPSRSPVVVAVVDTGVTLANPEFTGRVWTNPGETPGNGIDDDHNGYVDDVNGWNTAGANNNPAAGDTSHGTHVAGIIAARANNSTGIVGVADNARIMAVKVGESGATFPWSNVIAALAYVHAQPSVKVVNLSIGGGYNQAVCDAVAQLISDGKIVVAAAGNNNANMGRFAFERGVGVVAGGG